MFNRHNLKCNGEEEKEMDQDKKSKTESMQTEDFIEDTREFVRRSLRKQSSGTVVESESLPVDTAQTKLSNDTDVHVRRSSRSKHHKNKAKHHKDKRKRKRRFKTESIVSPLESIKRSSSDITSGDEEQISFKKDNSRSASELESKSNLKNNLRISTKTAESVMSKTEHIDSIEYIANVNINKNVLYHDIGDVDVERIMMVGDKNEQSRSNCLATSSVAKSVGENVVEQISNVTDSTSTIVSHIQSSETKDDKNSPSGMVYVNTNSSCSNININTDQEIEDRKLKKKRKRLKYDADEDDDENVKEDSSEDIVDDFVHKHRRKRHKHTNEHKNRKHHDVRKAPQDGIIVQEDKNACSTIDGTTPITIEKLQNETNVESLMSEPQRLAIKIKLCQECNNRHLQDACPLITPQYAISDSISYESWLNKHKENTEVSKAIKSDDPMSEGYGKITEDNNESDDESLLTEQCKTKMKTQKEEKQLTVDLDRPLYARDSLPECFELKITNSEHGLGIYAKNSVPMHVKLGPLVGQPVREMDIPDDFPMRHIWEVKSMQYFLFLYV